MEENNSPYRKEIGYPFSLSRECNSNPEFVKFKCPVCGHALGEDKYYDVCEEVALAANEIAKRIVEERIIELESEYLREIQRGELK